MIIRDDVMPYYSFNHLLNVWIYFLKYFQNLELNKDNLSYVYIFNLNTTFFKNLESNENNLSCVYMLNLNII